MLTSKQEAFALKYAETKNASASYRHAYDVEKMKSETIHREAHQVLQNHKVSARVDELLTIQKKAAEKKFTISVEQRLKWLKEIVDAGLEEIPDQTGMARRQNLAATNQAITTLNAMLGVDEDGGKVKPVKVMVGVEDASKP